MVNVRPCVAAAAHHIPSLLLLLLLLTSSSVRFQDSSAVRRNRFIRSWVFEQLLFYFAAKEFQRKIRRSLEEIQSYRGGQ